MRRHLGFKLGPCNQAYQVKDKEGDGGPRGDPASIVVRSASE